MSTSPYQNENRRTMAAYYAGAGARAGASLARTSLRGRFRAAGYSRTEARVAARGWLTRNERAWLPPKARRVLSADLAKARGRPYTGPAPRAVRRTIGAGPWPKLRRRAERAGGVR